MTTLLSPEKVDFARSVKNASAVLIVMMLINQEHPGHSTTADEIRDIIEMDTRTISNHLRSLSARDLALFDGRGYVLVERNALLLGNQALAPRPVQLQAPQAQALLPEPAGSDTHTPCVLLEEEELNTSDSLNSDSSSSSKSAQFAPNSLPTTLALLEATSVLWHSTMTTSGLEKKSRRAVIGWIAQAWDQRNHLRSPQGLIYARLMADKLPQEKYYDHPRDYLPEEYLIAVGLMQPIEEDSPEPNQPHDLPATVEAAPVALEGLPNHVLLWERSKIPLRNFMNKANFETWAEGTRAVRFDGNVLVVGCRNPYTVDWLTQRFTETIEQILTEAVGQTMQIRFVVVETE